MISEQSTPAQIVDRYPSTKSILLHYEVDDSSSLPLHELVSNRTGKLERLLSQLERAADLDSPRCVPKGYET
ncbi:hypothetical protein N781_13790 [Pontibacillus halophilus JSM 076056 = DSM 19796]|uniref:Uncharacterized protein n=1 Tax=Pontibacillus halophilus JSM 076056 = DSM 19796 TaxID=1385510 RepID=A0A0A5GPA4_9BACI|nr:hypothetical protein [Pontibacillus halophilus]KGX93053.1 hypothetical protein N781_13790 [Pontibacillus halophilus JSM 076056 = DSM 19796]